MITNSARSPVLMHKPGFHPKRTIMNPWSKSSLHMKKNPPITFSLSKLLLKNVLLWLQYICMLLKIQHLCNVI